MAVINPLKLVITNYPEGQSELLPVEKNPNDKEAGTKNVTFSRELYIEREDFMENPPKKYFRLFPGNEVRLRGAYFVKCTDVIKDEEGNVLEIHCTYDPETKSGSGFTGRKVKGTIHWVDANNAVPAEFRLYEPLILDDVEENKEKDFKEFLHYSKDALIIGHNVNYDISILNSELERCKMNKPIFKGVYDTLDIYRRFYPNLPNHKLETLSKIFPIKHNPSHNALDDVKATAYLLVYAINEKIRKI